MTNRIDDAEALVAQARSALSALKSEYEKCLATKTVSADMKVKIKGVLDNLRSALDFAARHVCQRCTAPVPAKMYFPISCRGAKETDFKSVVVRNLPGVLDARPEFLEVFSSYQEFRSHQNGWLPDLATLANENKHEQLTPQERRETRELRIQSGGAAISLGEGAQISIGRGASIQIGGLVIPEGQQIGVGSPPATIGSGSVEQIVWVSFSFVTTGRPVLPFLDEALQGVAHILGELAEKTR